MSNVAVLIRKSVKTHAEFPEKLFYDLVSLVVSTSRAPETKYVGLKR